MIHDIALLSIYLSQGTIDHREVSLCLIVREHTVEFAGDDLRVHEDGFGATPDLPIK